MSYKNESMIQENYSYFVFLLPPKYYLIQCKDNLIAKIRQIYQQSIIQCEQLLSKFMDNLGTLNKIFVFVIPIAISFSSFVMGYFIVYFTMLEQYLQRYHQYTNEESQLYFTLMTTLLPIGALVGACMYDRLVDTYGQNKVFKIMDSIAVMAIAMQLITFYTPILSLSRLLMGIYCGITSGIVPSYIISMSPSFTTAIVGTFNQIAIALGIAFAYYMGQFMDSSMSQGAALALVIGFPLICILVHVVVFFLFPYDNIRRHIQRHQNIIVRNYMKIIYGQKWRLFENQIRENKMMPIEKDNGEKSPNQQQLDQQQQKSKFKCNFDLKTTKINTLLLGVMLSVANQLSGITAILEYAKQLFLTIENGNEDEADSSVLLLGFFQVVVTCSSGFLISKFGRRPIMLIGMGIIILALLAGFFITLLVDQHQDITKFIIFVHILGYSISLGPICMLYAVEAFSSIKIVLIVYWTLSILISLVSDFLIEGIEISIMFLIFALFSILNIVFLYFRMIQTKGMTRKMIAEQIQGTQMTQENKTIIPKTVVTTKLDEEKDLQKV